MLEHGSIQDKPNLERKGRRKQSEQKYAMSQVQLEQQNQHHQILTISTEFA